MTHCCWPQFVMTHEMSSTCSTLPQIRKDGIIQTSPVVAMKNVKGPAHMVELNMIFAGAGYQLRILPM